MGRTVSGDSNTFQLTAGAAINGRDAIEIGPEGKAYPVVTTDYAAVTNCTYGTAQTSTATGRIFAQTLLQSGGNYLPGSMIDEQRIVQGDNGDIFALAMVSAGNGIQLQRYSAGGAMLGVIDVRGASGVAYCASVVKLSNGSIAVMWGQDSYFRFAIYTESLALVKADTTIIDAYGISSATAGITALSGGGFAFAGTPNAGSGLLTSFAIYDNSGNVVSAPATILTRTGTAGNPVHRLAQLSDGNIVIAVSMLGVSGGSFNGLWHAIYTPAGVQVLAMTQVKTTNAEYLTFLKVSGDYYAMTHCYSAGNTYSVLVFDNTGALQGIAYDRVDTSVNIYNQLLAAGDGCFWFMSQRNSDSTVQLVKIPFTGGAGASSLSNVTTSGTTNYNAASKMFVQDGYIVAFGRLSAASKFGLWVMREVNGAFVSSAITDIGPGFTSGNQTVCVIPGGDSSFIGYYCLGATAGDYIIAGKYANTSVVGVAAAPAAEGAPVNIKQAAGTYICNTLKGTAAVAFDHTTGATISGNKGTLLTNGVVLKGM